MLIDDGYMFALSCLLLSTFKLKVFLKAYKKSESTVYNRRLNFEAEI